MNRMPRKPVDFIVRLLSNLFMLVCIVFALFPALWMFFSSIKPQNELFTIPPRLFTSNPTFDNYYRVIFETSIPHSLLNSTFVSAMVIALTSVVALLAAYGFARYSFRGSKFLSTSLLFGQMLPAISIVIPLYMIYSRIGFINTYRVNILTNLAVNLPMAVITLTAFIRAVPREMDEAAKIDGSTDIGALFRIIVPMATPGLTTIAIFAFLNTWEEFLFAYNFTTSAAYKTLAIAINEFKGQFIIDWSGMMSAAMVTSVPVLIVFLLCNKYFIKGLTSGAVKG